MSQEITTPGHWLIRMGHVDCIPHSPILPVEGSTEIASESGNESLRRALNPDAHLAYDDESGVLGE